MDIKACVFILNYKSGEMALYNQVCTTISFALVDLFKLLVNSLIPKDIQFIIIEELRKY